MSLKGVSSADFTSILSELGVLVSYKVVSKTTDAITGQETTTFAAASNQRVIFFLNENKYLWDKEGLIAVGDAYIMALPSLAIKRYDQVTYDGDSYYIENVRVRFVAGVEMCHFGTLFKVA
jgi:hypothetical protein